MFYVNADNSSLTLHFNPPEIYKHNKLLFFENISDICSSQSNLLVELIKCIKIKNSDMIVCMFINYNVYVCKIMLHQSR